MKKITVAVLIFAIVVAAYLFGIFDNTDIIIIPKDYSIVFTDIRPEDTDKDVMLCVPAAYTSEEGSIIGHYSVGGKRQGETNYNYTTIRLDNRTHFQQASLVNNHIPKSFTDKKLRYRRALCLKDGEYHIVHSKYPITLTVFAKNLVDYDRAWNLDMGTFSYGWYRKQKNIRHLGLSSFWNRNKQTNWIVCKKK